jgi:uncharacterized membrane protein
MKLKHVWLLVAGTALLWGAYLIAVHSWFGSWSNAGAFGDAFGALNTFFTGLAFVVVCVTLVQQADQIKTTREDLAAEHALNAQTAEFVRKQAEALSEVARLTALTERIKAYDHQISAGASSEYALRMKNERHTLLLRLDEFLRSHGD